MIDLRPLFPKTSFVRDMSCRAGWCFATSNQVLKSTWSAQKLVKQCLMPSVKSAAFLHGVLVFPWFSRRVYKASVRDIFLFSNTLLRQGGFTKRTRTSLYVCARIFPPDISLKTDHRYKDDLSVLFESTKCDCHYVYG